MEFYKYFMDKQAVNCRPLRGMRDLFGHTHQVFQYIIKTAYEVAQLYGYQPIETPILESTSVFQRSVGETSDIVSKEMYTFEDKGGDSITLRPEGTAAILRAVLSNSLLQNLPLRLASHGPMFRYERPQKGRYRQLYQFGVEFLGENNPLADVEMIAMAYHILKKLNIASTLNINSLGDTQSRENYNQSLLDYFSVYENDLSPDSKKRLYKNPLRIMDSKDPSDRKICENAPQLKQFLSKESQDFFEKVCNGLTMLNLPFQLNQYLVRGLDYYCHTTFEFTSTQLGSQDAVLGGGRYDGLFNQLQKGIYAPGVGWAMGIDRLSLILKGYEAQKFLKIGIIPVGEKCLNYSLQITQQLREKELAAILLYQYQNIGKAIKTAMKNDCVYVIIFGNDEIKSQKIRVKNLTLPADHPLKEQVFKNLDEFFSHVQSPPLK